MTRMLLQAYRGYNFRTELHLADGVILINIDEKQVRAILLPVLLLVSKPFSMVPLRLEAILLLHSSRAEQLLCPGNNSIGFVK